MKQFQRYLFCFLVGLTASTILSATPIQPPVEPAESADTFQSFRVPDPGRPNQFVDSVRRVVVFDGGDVLQWIESVAALQPPVENDHLPDSLRSGRDRWIIFSIGLLILFWGVFNAFFPGEIARVVLAYYKHSLLSQLNKEDHLFSSWSFVFLYILFGFATGIFIYLSLASGAIGSAPLGGAEHFLLIASAVMVLFGLKILVTRLTGFVFDISRLLRRYMTVLYLGYFNAGLIFLVFAAIISLVPYSHAGWLVWTAIGAAGLFLLFRIVQVAVGLLINYRFPKFYLFMYLCALEIAPVLILIKVLYR